ncbi:hypothetical protein BsWGS_25154 [Bradybaena similaris]
MTARRRDAAGLDQFVSQLKDKQKKITDGNFTNNYIAIQQSLDELRDDAAHVTEVKNTLDEVKKTKGHTKEYENVESELLLVQDLHHQKKRCFESLLYVSEIENLFQNVQSDIESRAIYLSSRPKVFDSMYRGEDIHSQSRMHKDCVYVLRDSWHWLQVLNTCMEVHIHNAAAYHQFYHDSRHLEEDMQAFLQWLGSPTVRAQVKTSNPDVISEHFKMLTGRLLDYQGRVDRLTERSRQVHPIHYRKELPDWPVRAKALVKYEHKHVSLDKDDIVTVLDNSDSERWVIRTPSGQETEVAAIVLVIPPPDPNCFQEVSKLREQIYVNCETAAERLRSQLAQFLSIMVSQTQSKELQGLSANQKSDYMKLANDATQVLRGSSLDDPEYNQLKGDLAVFRKLISQIKPGQTDLNNAAVHKWNKTHAVLRQFVELDTYCRYFSEECGKNRNEEALLINDLRHPPVYISNAYFQRVIPTIDIDVTTKQSKLTSFKSEMYIHERHRNKAPPLSEAPMKKQILQRDEAAMATGDYVDGNTTPSFQTKISEVKNFVIAGVEDPRTKQRLTISQALSRGVLNKEFGTYNNLETGQFMPIAEAVSRGLISVEYGDASASSGFQNGGTDGLGSLNSIETKTFAVSGVVDPRTGETISVKEAIVSGLLDSKTGKFHNPVTGEELSLLDAVSAGYLMADAALLDDEDAVDGPMHRSYTSIVLEDVKYKVSRVINSLTGQEMSLEEAVRAGFIDPVLGIYKNPRTGEVMSIEEAMKQGLIKGRPFDSKKDRDTSGVLTFQQLQVRKQTFKAGEPSLTNGELDRPDQNEVLLDKLRAAVGASKLTVVDPKTGKSVSLEDAVDSGVIDLASGVFRTQAGDSISLMEACARGLIDSSLLEEILKAYKDSSLGRLISSGEFDPETGLVTDLTTGKTQTLQAAVQNKVIDPDSTFFYDLAQNKVLSLTQAIESGRLDEKSGQMINSATGERLSVSQAEVSKQICSEINADEIVERAESLALLRGCMDTSIRGIKIPSISDMASVEEAVTLGAVQIPKSCYADETSVGVVTLQLAVEMERVEPSVALALFSAFNRHSLEQEIATGLIDPKSGKYINPNTKQKVPVDAAKRAGISNPDYVYLVDQQTGNITTLGALVEEGKFDPASGQFIDGASGQTMSLQEAIARGFIIPSVEPEKYVDTSSALKDLIDSGKVNPRAVDFVAANDLRMSLRDALANGFLTMGSRVTVDPETGDVHLVSDEAVVQSLVEVKENSDWLSDVEKVLASQGQPSERLERLKQQADDCLGLKEEISRKEPEIQAVINQAELLVSENTKHRDQSEKAKDETNQQFQKLKSSTADLKVRFDMVNSEAETRSTKLTTMSRNLEELYYHIEELDQWLDSVIEKTQDLQTSKLDLETQYETLKEFVEEVRDKDEDMNAIVTSADAFKDMAQEVEREADVFRKRLEFLPTIKEEGETGVLDEEMESVEAKFKDISRECAKHMERLSSLLKQKKTFDDLNDKLTQVYPAIQERLNKLLNDDFGMDPQRGLQDLENIRALKADVIGQERKLKDLMAVGERLASGLHDSGLTDEAEDIQAIMDLKNEEHHILLEDVSEQEHLLDSAVAEQQNVLGRLDSIENVLREAEIVLEYSGDISLDKDHLIQQIQDQRLLNSQISSTRSLLERLGLDADGNRDAEEKVKALMMQAETLDDMADKKTQALENLLTNITEFNAKSAELDGWLTDSVKILKPKGGTPKPTKSKVEGLHEAKKEKSGEIEELRQMCDQLVDNDGVKDKFAVKETLADVETKWNDLTELLVQHVSLEALSEIDGMLKYLLKAENEINTAEPISIDPETLTVQLREHKSFDDDLKSKRNTVKDIIDKCTQMLQDSANLQSEDIKYRLESIKSQADVVCQASAERLQVLEAALPLANHYSENQTEISAWLEEMEAEMNTQGSPGESLEQVKKQHDNLKTAQQIIGDHKLFIDDLNSTGLELMDICAEPDAVDLHNRLLDTNKRYESLKSAARGKSRDLMDAKRKLTQEAAEVLDNLLDDLDGLHHIVSNADPIPSSPDKLKNEIDENTAVLADLDRLKGPVAKAEEFAKNPRTYGLEDPADVEDAKQKVAEIYDLNNKVIASAQGRSKALGAALKLSNKFYDLSMDIASGLRDLKEGIYNQEPPGVQPEAVKEQQAELAGLKKELEKARELVGSCRDTGAQLCDICGDPGAVEVQKQLEDLCLLTEDVNDAIRDRGDELRKAYHHADQLKKLLESISNWLPLSEHKLAQMKPPSTDPKTLHSQAVELRAFKADVHQYITQMEQVNQEMSALSDISPVAAESLTKPVKQANEKWTELLRAVTDRETKLTDMQLKVGEVNQAMTDIITSLDATEASLNSIDETKGDPKFLETQLRKLQLMQADIRSKEKAARKVNKAVDDTLQQSGQDINESPLHARCQEMNHKIRGAHTTIKEKENKLQASIRQVKKFLGDLDGQLAQVNDFRTELKSNQAIGALPESVEKQYADFVKKCQVLDNQEKTIENLLAAGQEMIDQCKPQDVLGISDRVKKLKERWTDTRDRARRRKEKLEEHKRNVGMFHDTLKSFTDWLNNAEISMRSLKHPSKLVPTVIKQIEDHNALRANLEAQAEKMNLLDSTGAYLKHFGRKQDTIYVKNMLVGIQLRWKKLLRRADERGRLLHQAYREDKRFDESWHELCAWLDESMQTLTKFMSPTSQPSGSKQDIDELKKFNHHLTAKHPTFFSTSRLGRNLKDRCTKTDPEREILNDMLENLKNKWNAVRAVVSKSQNKLDEALLTSGRVSDALQSLLEWLQKAEAAVDPETPILGDLDTVHMLLEQHRNIQQELAAREATVLTMKAPGNIPAVQAEELSNIWDRVNHLSDVREVKLKEALKLAEEFQDVVTEMREYLPHAEAQLKFRALPEDEMVILQFIEKHEKFQEDLRKHQDSVDKIKSIAEDILQSCHPNAVRFVKYYLTITQTRWDQLLQRAANRGQRLQEALRNIQGNAALLEELLAWLTDAQALLATKERDPIPDDLKVVEALLKEHLEFHDEVTSRNNDAERLSKLVTSESKMAAQGKGYGSNMKLNEFDGYNPRVIALQNKWRTVWHMSVDRKKRLQDAHDNLLELESFKNFDFDLWRQRYLNWIQAKKFRITDFFRRQDKDSDGFLDREEFVDGMLKSKFPTTRTELNAVFDIFDGQNRGLIEYKNFVDALKNDRRSRTKNSNRKAKTNVELIHEEIEKELSTCQCRNHFRAEWLEEGKYRFGEKQKTCLVRFLNHTVMVRVGGGWVTLEEFLEQNDPCRAKGRTNIELRETLVLADSQSAPNSGHTTRRGSAGGRTSPFPTGARRRQNDTGYASSNSSAGSNDSNLRRRGITSSMVNLASPNGNQSMPLSHSTDAFGSTGSLNRSKRLSTSSSNISGRKTPTSVSSSSASSRRPPGYSSRSTTPTVAFGTSVRSRPTTPTFSTHTPQRPGSVTPTKGLVSTPVGPPRQRRLPTTPKTPTQPSSQGFR